MALTKTDLDKATAHGCGMADCQHDDHGILYLYGACHLGGKIEVSYRNGSGVLRIGCRECGKVIALITVAEK